MKKKITQITGIRDRDGPYLAGFVLEKNYEVCGKIKRNITLSIKIRQTQHLL